MTLRWLTILCFVLSSCGAAADIEASSGATTLPLFDSTTTSVWSDSDTSQVTDSSTSTSSSVTSSVDETTTTLESVTQTTAAVTTTTASGGPTLPIVDPNAEFCQAAIRIDELGTAVSLDDKAAAAVFFEQQAERWAAAASEAPSSIAADVAVVATFVSELRTLMAESDYDFFAVVEEATALEVSLGSDDARIRSDQFIHATCEIDPPLAEQATAAFYGSLLETSDGREALIDILASAEIFPADGARCFVERSSADVMHPLVGAPSTSAQDSALADVLAICQLSIGAQP